MMDIELELYHVAFLVTDLDAAIAEFGGLAGHSFNAPSMATMRVVTETDDDDGTVESFQVAYSTKGPLHIELIEQRTDGVFGTQHPLGFHHAGYWVDDLSGQLAALSASGYRIETTVKTLSGGLLAVFIQPAAQPGVRLELVSTHYRERLEAWFKRV
jgi:catechol 2,3-dioxygenase-like lactoylglutathione lyase family enzyme